MRTEEAGSRPEVLDPLVQRQAERETPDRAPGHHVVDHRRCERHVDVCEDAMVAREADEVPEGLQQDVEKATDAATCSHPRLAGQMDTSNAMRRANVILDAVRDEDLSLAPHTRQVHAKRLEAAGALHQCCTSVSRAAPAAVRCQGAVRAALVRR